jgi:hypothetical protein
VILILELQKYEEVYLRDDRDVQDSIPGLGAILRLTITSACTKR